MNGHNFVILAYVIGLGLLWGYAGLLWIQSRCATKHGEKP